MIVEQRHIRDTTEPTRSFKDLAGATLEWSEDGFLSRTSTLRDGEHVVARLTRGSHRRAPATLETRAGRWRLHRVTWWRRDIHVDPERERGAFARFHGTWLGRGAVEMSSDRDAEWRPSGHFRAAWSFFHRDDVLMRFDVAFSPLRPRGRLVIGEAAKWAEVDPLGGLGGYLLLQGPHGAH